MQFTGERYLPSEAGVIAVEHWHRYAAIAEHVAGKRVLDAATGEGYGASLLARHAADVIGIDSAAEAVEHAAKTYGAHPNVRFQKATLPVLPFEDASFDVVVSFETLEHVPDAAAAFAELKRVLRPGGLLIASTPDRTVYSGKQGNRNEFHTHEMNHAEFQALCTGHFANVRMVGQKVYLASVIGPDTHVDIQALDCFSLVDGGASNGPPPVVDATYLICLCCDEELPAAAHIPSAFLDNSATAEHERETIMAWAQTLKEERDASGRDRDALVAKAELDRHERDALVAKAELDRHEQDALADQLEIDRQQRDKLSAENMELRHSLDENRRVQGQAIERIAGDVSDLRSSGFVERAVAVALEEAISRHDAERAIEQAEQAERDAERDAEREADKAFILDHVAAPLRGAQADLAAQVTALARLRALDIESLRSAIDHDRLAMETLAQDRHAVMEALAQDRRIVMEKFVELHTVARMLLAKADEAGEAQAMARGLQAELDAVRTSTSWRLTTPLRAVGRWSKRGRG